MNDWNEYRGQLTLRLREFSKLAPETMKGIASLGQAGEKTNHLDTPRRTGQCLKLADYSLTRKTTIAPKRPFEKTHRQGALRVAPSKQTYIEFPQRERSSPKAQQVFLSGADI